MNIIANGTADAIARMYTPAPSQTGTCSSFLNPTTVMTTAQTSSLDPHSL